MPAAKVAPPAKPGPADGDTAMIQRLILDNFGRFQKREFELSPATVFYGPNEAGKTTLFDALFFVLCAPKANRLAGKRLRERYGEKAAARIERAAGAVVTEIPEDEFLSLYAIRAGDIDVKLESGQPWLERVKSRLFSGDLDPELVIEYLEKLATERKNSRATKELLAVQTDLAETEERLAARTEQRTAALRRGAQVKELERKIEAERLRQSANLARQRELETRIESDDRVRERKAASEPLRKYFEADKARVEMDRLSAYARNRTAELDQLEQERASARDKLAAAELQRNAQLKEVEGEREEARQCESALVALRKEADLAGQFSDRIAATARNRYLRTVARWNPLRLALAGLVLAAGLAGGFFAGDEFVRIALIVGGVAGASLLALLARSVEQIPDDSAYSADVQRLREEWQRRTSRAAPAATTLDGLKDGFARLQMERDEQEKRLERLQQKLIERDRNLAGLEQARLEAAGALADADRRVAELLQQLGAGSRDEYLAARARYEAAEAHAARLAAELQRLAGERQPAEHRAELERRLKLFDEEGVGEEALPDADRTRLVGELRKLQGERETQDAEFSKLEQDRARLAGEMQGSLEPIAREIVELDQRRLRLAERLDQLKLDREAAKLAIAALRTLEDDANAMLETLAQDLQSAFTRIIPDARDLRFLKPSLDFGNIVVHDAAGTARALEALSTGTRDSFVFAARLALALRSSPGGPQLIALDEPFLTLDAARERNCLEYLRAFQEEHGWQLVLLTKEERLRDAAAEMLKDVRVHEL